MAALKSEVAIDKADVVVGVTANNAVPFETIPLLGLFFVGNVQYLKVGNSTALSGLDSHYAGDASSEQASVVVNYGTLQRYTKLDKVRFKKVKLVVPAFDFVPV